MEYCAIAGAIKQILKNKKKTYCDLGNYLGLSESGVKKLLSADDVSLNRLGKIAAFLEIPVEELMGFKNSFGIFETELSKDQESLFLRDLKSFQVYWMLVIERVDSKEILKRLKIKKAEFEVILLKLDKYHLIEVYQNYRFRLPPSALIRWSESGKFVRKLVEKWAMRLLKICNQNVGDSDYYQQLSTLLLYPETYRHFKQRLRELIDEIARQSERERLTYPREQLEECALMLNMAPESLLVSHEL